MADQARFGDECRDSKTDSVYEFDQDGNVLKSFGGGMFIWPHGLDVDRDGNVWITDAVAANRTPKGDKRGQQVVRFSPDGHVLMTSSSWLFSRHEREDEAEHGSPTGCPTPG